MMKKVKLSEMNKLDQIDSTIIFFNWLKVFFESGLEVSYSILNLKPYFLNSYSNPPKIAVSQKTRNIENSPPCPLSEFLLSLKLKLYI